MEVILSKTAEKKLQKTPAYIRSKLMYWISQVDDYGIEEVRARYQGFTTSLKRKKKRSKIDQTVQILGSYLRDYRQHYCHRGSSS